MLDKQDIKQLKELLKPLATKEDLEREIGGLADMINNSFNETEARMAKGFNLVREELKVVNEKLDKKVQSVDKRMSRLEEAIALK